MQFGADNFTENFTNQNGQTFPYNSIASDSWMEYASQLTETVVDAVLSSPKYAGKVVATCPAAASAASGLGRISNGHYDKSDACTKKFREWLKKTYGSDEALQAAWGNSSVTLAKAAIPGNVPVYNSNDSDKSTVLLEPAQQNIADYQLFYSELMASRIAELCRVVKGKNRRAQSGWCVLRLPVRNIDCGQRLSRSVYAAAESGCRFPGRSQLLCRPQRGRYRRIDGAGERGAGGGQAVAR